MRRTARARAGDAPTVATKCDGDQPWQAWRRTQLEAGETSVQLQSTNARTPPKTEEYQRPESKTIQQLAEPDEICKTSTPGSNPGGASNLPKQIPACKNQRDTRRDILRTEMALGKAVVVGLGVGVLAAVLWLIGNLWLPFYIEELSCRLQPSCGAAIYATTVGSESALLVAAVGFAAGFYLTRRRRVR